MKQQQAEAVRPPPSRSVAVRAESLVTAIRRGLESKTMEELKRIYDGHLRDLAEELEVYVLEFLSPTKSFELLYVSIHHTGLASPCCVLQAGDGIVFRYNAMQYDRRRVVHLPYRRTGT